MRRRAVVGAVALCVAVLATCVPAAAAPATDDPTPASPTTTPTPTTPAPPTPAPTPDAAAPLVRGLVTAEGVTQWVRCGGSGSPTVVLVPGLGASSRVFASVRPRVESRTRVCTYDRPGIGRSPAVGGRTVTAASHQRELTALLAAVGEPGPYVLVGHSYGSLVVRAFALRHPALVSGEVLLDGAYPDQWRYESGPRWPEGGDVISLPRIERQMSGEPGIGTLPLTVVTAGDGSSRWNQRQSVAARLSANSVHVIVPGSSHMLMWDAPAVVVRAVRTTLDAARTGRPLPVCGGDGSPWPALGASCTG